MPPPPDSKPRILTPNAAKARALDNAQSRSPLPKSPPPSPSQSPKPSFFSSLRARYAALPAPFHRSVRVLRALAPLVPIGMFFSEHVMQVVWVRGSSMTPYLNENYEKTHTNSDMVLVSMWPWSSGGGGGIAWPFDWSRRRRLERGMLITFRSPANPAHIAVKRIIGLPGDRISTRHPYPKENQIVPFNHLWVEGDAQDPKKSLDSNTYGPISVSLVTGRAVAVLRPRFRWLDWADWENGVFDNGDPDQEPQLGYRKDVRDRVVKGAVQDLENPVVSV